MFMNGGLQFITTATLAVQYIIDCKNYIDMTKKGEFL
jgi:hypothetical protein